MGHFVVGQLLTQFVEWHLSMLVEVVGIVGVVGVVRRVGSVGRVLCALLL